MDAPKITHTFDYDRPKRKGESEREREKWTQILSLEIIFAVFDFA